MTRMPCKGPGGQSALSMPLSSSQSVEKRFDRLIKSLRVVTHDRMARARDGGELAVRDGGRHALGGIGGENVALGAVNEQRRALQAPYGLPELCRVTLARTVGIAEDLVHFPGPRPARELAHAVAQTLADVVRRTPGVEALDVGHCRLQGGLFLRAN